MVLLTTLVVTECKEVSVSSETAKMCSVDPDEVIEMTQATEVLDISRGGVLCRKCEEAVAEVVLRVKDAYCRNCFLAYFTHKFRSTIGKSKQIHPGDRVLVGLSGGTSSTALLHLIHEGLQENSHKKLRFNPAFLYIDESVLCTAADGSSDHTQRVLRQVASLGFPCYVAALEQVMALQPQPPLLVPQEYKEMKYAVDENLKTKIHELFASCKSASAQQDLHDQLLQTVLRQCSQSLGFRKVFLGDNSTTLSIRILSQVALGRGSQLPKRVHFKAVSQNIEVYRPMREILQDEVLHYLRLQDITVPRLPAFRTKGSNITACTEEFVQGLQKEFPATIPTIFRTGDKLVAVKVQGNKRHSNNGYLHEDDDFCALCASKLDTDKGEASALHATIISQKYSSKKPLKTSHDNEDEVKDDMSVQEACKEITNGEISSDPGGGACWCAGAGGGCDKTVKSNLKDQDLRSAQTLELYLCYGCRVTVRDLKHTDVLPAWVQTEVVEQEQRRVMREQIQDFLL